MSESFLEKISDAKCNIQHAFSRYMDFGSDDEQLRIADALRCDAPHSNKSVRWSVPLAVVALIVVAFVLGSAPMSPSRAALSHSDFLFGKNGLALLSSSNTCVSVRSLGRHRTFH
jgi:hypothetical protein